MIEGEAIAPIRKVVEDDTLRKEGLMKMHFTRLRYGLDPAEAVAWAALSLVEAPVRLEAYLRKNAAVNSSNLLRMVTAQVTKETAYLVCDALRVNHKTDKNSKGPLGDRDSNASRGVVKKALRTRKDGSSFPAFEIDPTFWFK